MGINKVSLDEILELKEKGKRLYKIEELREPFEDNDIKIKAIINSKNKIYIYEGSLWFYGYEKGNEVEFDPDGHPYWNAWFEKPEQNSFKLYDGIFFGRFGCGGFGVWLDAMEKVYTHLSTNRTKNNKKLLNGFYNFYESISSKEAYTLKKEFGLCEGVRKESSKSKKADHTIRDYILYDGEKKEKFLQKFGNWYERIINKNGEYDRKIKVVRKKEHETSFKKYVQEIIKKLESKGFKRTLQQPQINN